MLKKLRTAVACCALLGVALGCDDNDVGKLCGLDEPLVDAEPVTDEDPVVEVVGLQRDGVCESFQCLTHAGLPSYCTRECEYDEQTQAGGCEKDSDCDDENHCFEGVCQDDDCPKGFVCAQVQEVGPLAEQLFCVRRECQIGKNVDCEDPGKIQCEHLGCLSAKLLDPSSLPLLTCEPMSSLDDCSCPGGGSGCGDSELVCDPSDADAWPAGSVEQHGYCQRSEF
jgi:hypothetical protein